MNSNKSKFTFPLWLDKYYLSGSMFYSLMLISKTANQNRIPVIYPNKDYVLSNKDTPYMTCNSDIVASVVGHTTTQVDGIVLLNIEWEASDYKVQDAFYTNPSIWDIRPIINFNKLIGFEFVECSGIIKTTKNSVRDSIRGSKLEEFILSLTPEELDDFCKLGYPEVYGRLNQDGVDEDVSLHDLYDAVTYLKTEVEILSRWSSPMKVMNTTIQNEETRLDK